MKKKIERRKDYRRKNIQFLSSRFRNNFIIRFCLIVSAGALLAGSIIYLTSRATLTTTFEGSRLKIISTADFILPAVILSTAVVIIFISLVTILFMVLSGRNVQRSLCQIEDEIEKAESGDLNVQLNFRRRNDEFKVLAHSVHRMVGDFKKVIGTLKRLSDEIESELLQYEESHNHALPAKLKEKIANLKEELSSLRT